ncbi:MAG: hypothetical protein EP329_28565 [Deltaproteobacteria bacterium]|nr:MAG: hypothetical protein EP329_28565 [Deltaproteobacteria bacterium]
MARARSWTLGALFGGLAWTLVTSGACAPTGPAEKVADGSPCTWNVDCVSGLCLAASEDGEATGWADGMCASPCDDGCGDGGVCVRLDADTLCLPGCEDDSGCRDGYVCATEAGACMPDCRLDWTCGDVLVCDEADGVCKLPSVPGADFGAACVTDLDCASGICIAELDDDGVTTGWVGGVCSESCAAGSCASGGTCVRLDDLLLCTPACEEGATTCGEGLVCNGAVGACLPDCRLDWACSDGFTCDADSGSCSLETVTGAAFGEPCEQDANCASGICAAAYDAAGTLTGWADGMCLAPCGSAACGDTSVCAVLDGASWCVPGCDAATPCRDGYVCSDALAGCLPDCRLGWECGDDLTCDAATGACALSSGGAAFGEPCVDDVDCASGLCIAEHDDGGASTGWVGGVCTESCAAGTCASGGACVRLDDVLLCVPACAAATDCGDGLVCNTTAAACLPDCRLGWACGDGFACAADTGVCALENTVAATLGEPCDADSNCASGVCAAAYDADGLTGWSDGMCIAPCGSADCGDASECVVLDAAAWCVPACDALTACRSGYVCEPELGACLPDCRLGWECGAALACDATTGTCEPAPLSPVGSACTAGADCATGICAEATDADGFTGWTDGMCIGACGSELCGAATTCAVLEGAAWCLPDCSASCRTGYVCDPDYGACLPDCRLGWACLAGYVCGETSGVCEAPSGSGLWDPCDSDDDCDSGLCVLQDDPTSTWTTSRCSAACAASCAEGFACTLLGAESVCLPTCVGQQDCEVSWTCDATVDVCVPSCQAGWVCPDGTQCNAAGQCRTGGPGGG